jgi:hypothetical protein
MAELERDPAAPPAETLRQRWTATWNMKFGTKIWFDKRPMFAVIAGAEDCRVSEADPVPQWQKCVDAVIERMNAEPPLVPPALSREDDIAEAVQRLKWIKEFSEAHHAAESSGRFLHSLTIDIPHYLDYVLGVLEREPSETERDAAVTRAAPAPAPKEQP